MAALNQGWTRLAELDATRGLIVALMALDHVRIFFANAQFDPTDLDRTDVAWFATRWVTHLCAPGFFFIAGMAAALYEKSAGKRATAWFLLSRGAWLVVLEIAVFGFAWSFSPGWWWLGVIWGLGASMIVLSTLIFAPRAALLTLAVAFTVLHANFWPTTGLPDAAQALLHGAGEFTLPLIGTRLVLYPLLPWLALMTLGYCSAGYFASEGRLRTKRLLVTGLAAIAAFVGFRHFGFGAPVDEGYRAFTAPDRNLMSFMNVEKYPPSLQYSLVTLGVLALAAALFAALQKRNALRLAAPLDAYGRTPFFFYLVHLFLIHAFALAAATLLHWPTDYVFWRSIGPNLTPPDGYGFGLAGVYMMWLVVLAIMYPLCLWFGRLKRNRADGWLRYL